MQGYHGLPEKTAKVLEPHGWIHTNDTGELSNDGYLRITDRNKDLIKRSGGQYIPHRDRGQFQAVCPYLSNILVRDADRNFSTAPIAPDEPAILQWARRTGWRGSRTRRSSRHPPRSSGSTGMCDSSSRASTVAVHQEVRAAVPRDLNVDRGEITRPETEAVGGRARMQNLIDEMHQGTREA